MQVAIAPAKTSFSPATSGTPAPLLLDRLKKTALTIAAITQPALYSASQKCANILISFRRLRRQFSVDSSNCPSIRCRFIHYSTHLGGLKESFWFHHLIFM